MPVLGSHALGSSPLGGAHSWGAVSVAVTAPSSVVTSVPVTVQWGYTNSEGVPQAQFRVRLLTQAGTVLEDSGVQTGSNSSWLLGYVLSDLSNYRVEVTAWSAEGQWGVGTKSFTIQTPDSTAVANTDVGKIYEVAINGTGYMLYDDRDGNQQLQWGRQIVGLEAQRLVQGETAFNDAVERYSFFKWNDWSHGAGQRIGSRADSDVARFYDSDNVDVFSEPGELRLLPITSKQVTAAYAGIKAVAVGDRLYVVKGTNVLRHLNDMDGTETDLTLASVGTISDITTDGQVWYVCDGTGVWRGTTSDPGAAWSTEDASVIGWAGARLCAAVQSGGTGTYRVFKTLADDGTVEATRLTLPAGWSITNFSGGPGFVYFGAYVGNSGLVYAWQTGSSNAPSVAMELPLGERPVHVYSYQGQVMVRALRSDGTPLIYRCPASSDGTLTPFLVAELTGASAAGQFVGSGRFVYFSWDNMHGAEAGVGIIDLSTGGYAKNLSAGAAGAVTSLTVWRGRVAMTVASVGAYVQDDTYQLTGWLRTSILDGGSALEKIFDEVSVQTLPLLAGQSVVLSMSLDRGESYTNITHGTMEGTGLNRLTQPLEAGGNSIGLQVTLNGPGTSTPTVTLTQVKAHPHNNADVILQLPISCWDVVNDLNGRPLQAPRGDGALRARRLEALAESSVQVQDIDWPNTGVVETYEVVGVRTFKRSTKDPAVGDQLSLAMVVVLTLRRPLT